MSKIEKPTSQQRAVRAHRQRQSVRGVMRFEVVGRESDRSLIRSLARCLAQDDAKAIRLRDFVRQTLGPPEPTRGAIFAALRQSPLVAEDLDLSREGAEDRIIDL